jgi:hypothetical protein
MDDRGTGRTRRAMEAADHGAIYIWCNGGLSYPKQLAKHLGRDDLKIYSPSVLEDGRLRGILAPEIVVDHATRLTDAQYEQLDYVRQILLLRANAAQKAKA